MPLIKTYSELIRIPDYYERYEYLKLSGIVGESTFGWHRYINQMLYQRNKHWKSTRNKVIIRDDGCDFAHSDYQISDYDRIIVHHINPITLEDVEEDRDCVYDLENLICTTQRSHNAIHYGDRSQLPQLPIERRPGDTCPWH